MRADVGFRAFRCPRELDEVKDESLSRRTTSELGEVFTQDRVLVLVLGFFLVGGQPILEELLCLNIEVEPRRLDELVREAAVVSKVGIGEFLENLVEAGSSLRCFRIGRRVCVWAEGPE